MTDTSATMRTRIDSMNGALADNWWAVALRGVVAIIFSLIAFFMPGVTMLSLVLVFAAYSLVDGVFGIISAIRGARRGERWGLLLVNSLLSIAAGVVAAIWPGITVIVFVYLLAFWALISGGFLIGAAFDVKRTHGRGWMIAGGIVSVLYGILLLLAPLIGALVLTWWVGAHALVLGVTLLVLAFQLRRHRGERSSPLAAAA